MHFPNKATPMPTQLPRLLLLLALPGCATIVHGTTQNLTVTTNPPGASCRLERDGVALAMANPTPATVRINKGRSDIIATCTLAGYDPTTYNHISEFGGGTFGNVIVGGLIGVAVDAASGANYPYPPEFVINLQPTGGPPVVQPEHKKTPLEPPPYDPQQPRPYNPPKP
ncbi:MAG: hypothetical protein NTY94_14160 [Alphaproteobacteria bacterium]|nr:hypothetical protein [Alphaproteobacteria bacterium]